MGEKLYGAIFILIALVTSIIWILGTVALLVVDDINNLFYSGTKLLDVIPVPPLIYLMWIPILLAVLLVAVIFGWVGIALVRTPSLEEIDVEELEREIEEEAKKLEETKGEEEKKE